MKTFKDLEVWQKSLLLVKEIYTLTKKFPQEELYTLTSQLRRASISIPSNIAEGSKKPKKEFVRFITIAEGSAAEVETQLYIASLLGYSNKHAHDNLIVTIHSIMKMLTKLRQSISASINQ